MKSKITKTMLFAFVICLFTALTVFSVSAATVTQKKLVYEVKGKTATLIECKSNAKKITIPSKVGKYKVTAIGEWAFSEKKKLTKVTIPSTVTKIGKAAFNECTALKKVVIPSSVKKISAGAFWYCKNLESVVVPKSVKTLGKNVFEGCEKLTAYVVKGSKGEKYIKKQKNVTLAYRYMTSLSLSVSEMSLIEGDTATLTVKKKPKKLYNGKVKFSSADPEVVAVDAKGVLTAKKAGKAVITCTAKDGSKKTAVCTVTVKAKKDKETITQTPTAPAVTDKVTVPADTKPTVPDTTQTTVPTPKGPEKVTKLTAENITCTGYTLTWTGSYLNNGYIVSRYDTVSEKWTDIYDVTENTFSLTGLTPCSEERYRVTAYTSENGKKVYAEPSDEITVATVTFSEVTELTVSEVSDSSVALLWDKAENATGYKIYLYDPLSEEYTYMYASAENEFTVSGLNPATEYAFAVRSCFSDGYVNYDSEVYSDIASAKTLPGRVQEIKAAPELIYPDRLTLSWDAVEGAEGYNLYIYSKEKGEYELYAATAETEITVSELTTDTDYFFKIKTFILSDEKTIEGAFSEDFMFTTAYVPVSSAQAAESFIDALYNMQSETASFELSRTFTVKDVKGGSEEISAVIDSVSKPSFASFTVSEGKEITNGAAADEIIWPFGNVSDLYIADIDNGTLSYAQDGYGYNLEFTLSADKAFELVCPTDFDRVREENEGFTLLSYEAQDGLVTAKTIGSAMSMMKIAVPVTATFTFGGERYEISYTLSQIYLF